MCISNIGNRRPYPTNGFTSSHQEQQRQSSLLTVKDSLVTSTDNVKASSKASSKNAHAHIIVQHNYHDHASDDVCSSSSSSQCHPQEGQPEGPPCRGGVTTPFPIKLHHMLNAVEANGQEHIVSWQPHGRCFVVHDPKAFVSQLLPQYFKLTKLASFQRQLNLYGFARLTRSSMDKGGYYHERFLKGRVALCHDIPRIKVKGTGVRARSNPDQEPDFWRDSTLPWVQNVQQQGDHEEQATTVTSSSSSSSSGTSSSSLLSSDDYDFFAQQLPVDLEPKALGPAITVTSYTKAQKIPAVDCADDDVFSLSGFGDKHFHCVPSGVSAPPAAAVLSSEIDETVMDAFFDDFDFPEGIGNEIENDQVFGDLLERMMA